MVRRRKMTEDELIANIELFEQQSGGSYATTVANEQAEAMNYYLRKPFGTEEEGRSQVVSSDVWDVVEGLTPIVLKPFVSSDDIVRFSPENAQDEDAADQESDYINYVVTQKNDIFETLVAWVKTGLLQKNGIVKYWWETSTRTSIERYYGISDDMFALLQQDDTIKVVAHTEHPGAAITDPTTGQPHVDPQTGQPIVDPATGQPHQEPPTHDVVLRISKEHGFATYRVIPPEEFIVSRDATSSNPKSARFVEHRTKKTISELREMGYDVEDDINDTGSGDDLESSMQYIARRQHEDGFSRMHEGSDPSTREVTLREVYMLVDFDGDGIAELRKVCMVGRTVLENEETEEIPFCGWTPYPQPFKFDGLCPADEAKEFQLIKSTTLRQTMDNLYTINNNTRYVSNKVNIDDLLDNQIAGIVRIDGDGPVGNHVMPAPVTPIGQITLPMMEYFDSAKENRTGFTRYNQGSDSNSLNKTATGIRIIAEAGNERIALVSRCFAEQGLKQLMLGIHGLCRRHATEKETFRLRGKWVEIDPREWKTRYDMSVSVGLGSADKQIQMQAAQMLLQQQMAIVPLQNGIVTPKNLYEAGSKLATALGEKNPDKFFTAPPDQPPAPPDPMQNPEIALKVKEAKQKDEEMQMVNSHKTRELDIKEQELQLKKRESEANLLMGHAKLSKDMAESHHKVETDRFGQAQQVTQMAIDNQPEEVEAEPDDSGTQEAIAKLSEQMTQIMAQLKALATPPPQAAQPRGAPNGQA